MPGFKFQIYIDMAGNYRMRAKAANNRIIFESQEYVSRYGVNSVIRFVKRFAANADVEDLT